MTRFAVYWNHHAERTGSKLSNAVETVGHYDFAQPCQPLELNGSEQIIVLEQRGARVVNAGVSHICSMRFVENRATL
jgi:hypothetical protein